MKNMSEASNHFLYPYQVFDLNDKSHFLKATPLIISNYEVKKRVLQVFDLNDKSHFLRAYSPNY